jgi:hypothetical protein
MTIARKPKATTPENFIDRGGSAATDPNLEGVPEAVATGKRGRPRKEKEEEVGVKLRLTAKLLERIDTAVESTEPAPSRHQWILQAIYEKLERS